MTLGERYSAVTDRCSQIELNAVWSALLLGRVRDLKPHLVPIANAIEGLRDELRVASIARFNLPQAPQSPPGARAHECSALDYQLRQGEI